MFYEQQLQFLCATCNKCHIKTALVSTEEELFDKTNKGDRSFLNDGGTLGNKKGTITHLVPATVYRFTDLFLCQYIFLLLPGSEKKILVIGPYINSVPEDRQIVEWLEKYSVSVQNRKLLEQYYLSVPILKGSSHLFLMLEAFCDSLWGENGYKYSDLNGEDSSQVFSIFKAGQAGEEENTLIKMEMMEKRYAFENELINAVASGHIHKAELIMSRFSEFSFEKRVVDQLRNTKNYCIIMNTLLRKAVEKGGVHPIYIDSVSSDFAVRIEKSNSSSTIKALMDEMFRSYCRLVKKHSMRNYSPQVQKTIACIDSDLTADLTLNKLAGMQNISASYLSTIFKKETGVTLTSYVNQRRITQAMHLLETTKIQVQTVAQHCGIDDVHYFTKLFKRQTGMTPKEYRQKTSFN